LKISDSQDQGNLKYINIVDNDQDSMLQKGFLPSQTMKSFALAVDFSFCKVMYTTWLPPPLDPLKIL
jgi:hypothetical protein